MIAENSAFPRSLFIVCLEYAALLVGTHGIIGRFRSRRFCTLRSRYRLLMKGCILYAMYDTQYINVHVLYRY